MVVLHVSFRIEPADRAVFLERARRATAATRAEDGCQRYQFTADVDDENRFLLVEEWVDRAALGAHTKTPHFADFRAEGTPLMRERVALMFDVSAQREV